MTQELARQCCHNGSPATLGAARRKVGSKTRGPCLLRPQGAATDLTPSGLSFVPWTMGLGMVATWKAAARIYTRGCGSLLTIVSSFPLHLPPKSPMQAGKSLCVIAPLTVPPGLVDLQGPLKTPMPAPPAHDPQEHTCGWTNPGLGLIVAGKSTGQGSVGISGGCKGLIGLGLVSVLWKRFREVGL